MALLSLTSQGSASHVAFCIHDLRFVYLPHLQGPPLHCRWLLNPPFLLPLVDMEH